MGNEPIMSVSGIRGRFGEDLTTQLFARIAFIQTRRCGGGEIIVGRDTRPSGALLAEAAYRGILAAGGIPINIGIAPTPTTCFAVKHFGASGGIIITASHNPHPYNGYKMVHASGRLYNAEECEAVYKAYRTESPAEFEDLSSSGPETPIGSRDPITPHVERILSAVNVEAIRNARLKVAVDSTNGAGGAVFPSLLEQLGVEWEGVHISLDGDFAHNPEPRPEHLTDLSSLLKSRNDFSAGFAFDPDADRLAPMGEHGEPISEEMTPALAFQSILSKNKSNLAVNLSTSMVIDDVAKKFGVTVFRTPIGEANVVKGMYAHDCGVGGEGNGGVIYPKVATVRDGLTALALILDLMAETGKPITRLVSQYPHYSVLKEKVPIEGTEPAAILSRLSEEFADDHIDVQDGLKIYRPEGWVHIRASNTEPILRCIAEASSKENARRLADMVMDKIG